MFTFSLLNCFPDQPFVKSFGFALYIFRWNFAILRWSFGALERRGLALRESVLNELALRGLFSRGWYIVGAEELRREAEDSSKAEISRTSDKTRLDHTLY